jgi:hypothetical protein
MGRCKLECPDDETECCICCTKQDSCQCRGVQRLCEGGRNMITFLLGFTLGTIFGVVGLVCVAIMYDKHHSDE